MAHRVVDEYQIERHFSQNDLSELYRFTPDKLDDPDRKPPPIPNVPKDRLLADMMKVRANSIFEEFGSVYILPVVVVVIVVVVVVAFGCT